MEIIDRTKQFFKTGLDLGHHSEDQPNKPKISYPRLAWSEIALRPRLHQAVAALKFETATEVQSAVIPKALEGKDLVAQAKTGSGKTMAFVLPLLHQLEPMFDDGSVKTTYGLIITPTRELAQQIAEVIISLKSSVQPVLVIGGENIDRQIRELEDRPQLVVGTPGRILDLMRRRALRLKDCRFVVLDEADEMFSMGFYEDVRSILTKLPEKRQGLFVSATISPRVRMLAGAFLTDAEQVVVGDPNTDLPPIEHFAYLVSGEVSAKLTALGDVIESLHPQSAFIFCNTKSDTELVEAWLRRRGFDARRTNSDLTQKQRSIIMDKIKNKELRFLVATDVAARGLDVDQIQLVVNYSLHEQPETYLHRSGRTGRAGHSGIAISLVGPRDLFALTAIKNATQIEFKDFKAPTEKEIADARLSHLYEVLRGEKFSASSLDRALATELLKEVGGLEEIPEELEIMLAKLCGYALAHSAKPETKSLDEELDAPPEPPREEQRDYERRGGGGSGGGGNRGRYRDNRGRGGRR